MCSQQREEEKGRRQDKIFYYEFHFRSNLGRKISAGLPICYLPDITSFLKDVMILSMYHNHCPTYLWHGIPCTRARKF